MTPRTNISRPSRSAFTLIELILVMAVLAVVLAFAAPSLSRFFRGRSLDSEAHRFLALTRLAQSRAVAEGMPMVLWIDTQRGQYGLQAETSDAGGDAKAKDFVSDASVEISVVEPAAATTSPPFQRTLVITANRPALRFTPDGFIGASSPERILFSQSHEGDSGLIWVGLSRNRLNYEIETDNLETARR